MGTTNGPEEGFQGAAAAAAVLGAAFTVKPEEDNGENISIVFKLRGKSFEDKAELYLPYFRQMVADGFVLREVSAPASHRMQARLSGDGEWREVIMLGSNNYLGLAEHPYVKQKMVEAVERYGVGCAGPPLLNGMTAIHRELERRLAALKGCEEALLFSSGYSANIGWTVGLLSSGDYLVYDALNHASLFDGMRLGHFRSVRFEHNDLASLEAALKSIRDSHARANVVVCVEGVYSMDGDLPPLREIRGLCDRYLAYLAIDDAHGTGVLGTRGHGAGEHFGLEGEIDIVMGTFSKTFATAGGFVAGPSYMIEFLRSFARSYMFSAALPTPVAASVLAGLDVIEREPERVRRLHENAATFQECLRREGYSVASETPIFPIPVPEGVNIRHVVRRLFEEGVFVNGVEFPVVPLNRQRLRATVMATMERSDLERAAEAFGRVGREVGML